MLPAFLISAAKLIGCILLCQAAGAIGALTTDTGTSPWYQSLNKPSFNPPGWVFGPVWVLLYTLMGVALFLLIRDCPSSRWALLLFGAQLALNAAWTPIFFGMHRIGAALVVILLMWTAILLTIIAAWPFSRWAAGLLTPYLLWVSFAALLNAMFARLN